MVGLIKILNLVNGIGENMTLEDLKGVLDELFNDARDVIQGYGPSEDIMAIATETSAPNGSKIYGWLGSVPGVQEWVGTKKYKQLREYNYIVRNREWYNAITLIKKELRRNGLIDVPQLLQDLLQQHEDHKKEMLIEALCNGDAAQAYDGVAFFSNITGARVNDNLMSGTGTALANIKADIISTRLNMSKFVNDNGKIMRVVPNTIVCPMALETTFLELKNSTSDPTSSSPGTANVASGYIDKIIADPMLDADDPNDWYYIANKGSLKPLVLQTEVMNEGDEFETVLDETKWASDGVIGYSVESASNVGYGIPALAAKIVNA